jgi:hypothetical protein
MTGKHLSDANESNPDNLDAQIQSTTGHSQPPATEEAGLFPKNIGEGIARGVEIAGGGVVGGIIGGIVDHFHHPAAAQPTPAAPHAATPAGPPSPPASSTETGSAPYHAPASTDSGSSTDGIAQTNASHQSLEDAQRAAEQHMAEVAAARQKARDEYHQRMAEEDQERAANQQDAESGRQALEEAHRSRGEYGFTGGDGTASADNSTPDSGSSSGV